MNKYLKSLRQK